MSASRNNGPTDGWRHRLAGWAAAVSSLSLLVPSPAAAASDRPEIRLDVEEVRLENGMKLLLVERPDSPDIAAGWVVGSGSADDPRARRGLAHVLEHLMFKGSRVIGTRDYAAETAYENEANELRQELGRLRARGKEDGRRAQEIETRVAHLDAERRRLLRLGEFALHYSEAGASGLNAFTFEDFSLFFVRLPPGKLELWFWLESDRLMNPVFREFDKEKGVIRQEVGQRVESAPTGRADAALRRAFWSSSSYSWQPLGEVEDLAAVERSDAERFWRRHYPPQNLTAVLVGRFDRRRAGALAQTYFGRLAESPETAATQDESTDPGGSVPPRGTTASIDSGSTFETNCDCPTQARVLYPSVPFRHPDSYGLQLLAGVLNGRTGRLYRALVLGEEIAFSASATQLSYRGAGSFVFSAETKARAAPEALVAAWDRELTTLAREPVGADELRKVKNQLIASSLRGLRRPSDLARQLLVYAGLGDWRQIEDWPRRIDAVTAEELRDAARSLTPDHRLVAIYRGPEEGKGGR